MHCLGVSLRLFRMKFWLLKSEVFLNNIQSIFYSSLTTDHGTQHLLQLKIKVTIKPQSKNAERCMFDEWVECLNVTNIDPSISFEFIFICSSLHSFNLMPDYTFPLWTVVRSHLWKQHSLLHNSTFPRWNVLRSHFTTWPKLNTVNHKHIKV